MESGDREIKNEELSGNRKVIKIDLENIDSDPIVSLKKMNLDTTTKIFSSLAQQHKAMNKAIRNYEKNNLLSMRRAMDIASSNVSLIQDAQMKLHDSLPDILNISQKNIYTIPVKVMEQTALVGKQLSDLSKGLVVSHKVLLQNKESLSRFFEAIQYLDIFKQIDIQDITKDKVNTFSSELITVSEDFPLDISASERGELISFLETSLDKLTKFEAESYVLHPHQYFLTDKIIKAYRSNNYFYIPFIGFSLIDSLFKDVLQTIKETQRKLANSWEKKKSNGKSALAYNALYNTDFNFHEMHQIEIYSLLRVYENLYANYDDNYSGVLNRNAVMHGDWVDIEEMGKYEALRIMQFIVVLEKNIDMIQKIFQNHVKNQLLSE
ncbi:hypothetical protein HB825_10410 [Listeria booriae]|uniref:Uncharacterized protein n=1 Tax=Listeria booriae TaxID=1552123 RepID=A0A7X0XDX2_9LIST|nr:hypothetical protein [Listeria booriae]MBC1492420.1 hypothetical protein [Listeria booriae]MBC1524286.1 hypothetical protein [Listeria booriae]MBC1531091.1 hypothetical protein [Listeria booriae]MBC6135245.1 hypothetical protein [Listeria booriae]